jgi:neutral ceramidase
MTVRVGSARVDITPPLTVPYLGLLPRQAYFTGVHDPLFARALVFDDGTERAALVCADAIGLGNHILGPSRSFTDEVRARIERRCGLRGDHVMVSSTHAHSTPETLGITRLRDVPAALPWLEILLDQLASAVEMACDDTRLCTLKVGTGLVLGVARNRRPAWEGLSLENQAARGRLDPQLQVLLCQDEEGNARQVLLNFQCHPVTVQVQPMVSADYPGAAMEMVARGLPGCRDCLFLQGAAGNLNPVRDDTRDFRDVALYGTMVAGEALKVTARLLGGDVLPMEEVIVRSASARVAIPPRVLPEKAEWETKLADARALEQRARGQREKLKAAQQGRDAQEVLDSIERFSVPREVEVQVLRIGDLAIASTPGEMFTEWGLKIKKESPSPHTFIAELANGWAGYLLNPGGFTEGGYEASPGPWTQTNEEGAALLADTAISLIGRLWPERSRR